MWAELLEELVYGILDQPTIESVHNHWNLVVYEDVPIETDPQKQLQLSLVSLCQNYEKTTVFPSHSKELVAKYVY